MNYRTFILPLKEDVVFMYNGELLSLFWSTGVVRKNIRKWPVFLQIYAHEIERAHRRDELERCGAWARYQSFDCLLKLNAHNVEGAALT